MDGLSFTVRNVLLAATIFALIASLGGCWPGTDGQSAHAEAIAEAEQLVNEWLGRVGDSDDSSWGYDLLHPTIRQQIAIGAYLAAIDGGDMANWRVRNESDRDVSELGEFFTVFVEVDGGSSGAPPGLVQLGLIQPWTVDGVDIGVAVIVKGDDGGRGIWDPIGAK